MAACFFRLASRALSLWFPRAIFPKFQQSARRIPEAAWQQLYPRTSKCEASVDRRAQGARRGNSGTKFGNGVTSDGLLAFKASLRLHGGCAA